MSGSTPWHNRIRLPPDDVAMLAGEKQKRERTPFQDPCPYSAIACTTDCLYAPLYPEDLQQGMHYPNTGSTQGSALAALNEVVHGINASMPMHAAKAYEQDTTEQAQAVNVLRRTEVDQPGNTVHPLTSRPAGDAQVAEVLDLIAWQTPLTWHRGNACTEDVWPPILQEKVCCWPPQAQAWLSGLGH